MKKMKERHQQQHIQNSSQFNSISANIYHFTSSARDLEFTVIYIATGKMANKFENKLQTFFNTIKMQIERSLMSALD